MLIRSGKRDGEQPLRVVGSKWGTLRLVCMGFLFVFMLVVACLILADVSYLASKNLGWSEVKDLFVSDSVINAIQLSLSTSLVTLALVVSTAIPIGYALSRFRLPGYAAIDALVDVPIVLPPVVIGTSLLAFFGFGIGAEVKQCLKNADVSLVSWIGIVLCQYLVSISYCIRSAKAAFDSVDRRYEHAAYTLGCSEWSAFWRVSLPLARNGVIAGCIMAWARGIGVFGPLMVFVGTAPRVRVMPTTMWLELSIGNVEVSLALALIMLAMAMTALFIVHAIAPGGEAR